MVKALSLFIILLSVSCTKQTKLTILHTNDHHGHFLADDYGRYGMAARKTLIDKIRAQVKSKDGYVLLLSGGDINTGTPESDVLDAKPDFIGMNKIGYDAMAVGNHEFDNSLDVIKEQVGSSKFPWLSANIYKKGSSDFLFKPYIEKNINGHRIAIIGFTTEDTPFKANIENTRNVTFRPVVDVAKEMIPELKEKFPFIIAVTHIGHYTNGKHGVNSPGDVSLAKAVKGINLIVGGHTQKPLFKPDFVNGTYIVQAHEWGKYVGRMDIILEENGNFQVENYELIPINHDYEKFDKNGKKAYKLTGNIIEQDEELRKVFEVFKEISREKLDIKIGQIDNDLNGERKKVRSRQMPIGRFVGHAIAKKCSPDANLAIMNGGGIRDGIKKGPISFGDLHRVHPYGNSVACISLKGKKLKEIITLIRKQLDGEGNGGYPHFYGLDGFVSANPNSWKVSGKKIDNAKTYILAMSSFSAMGGDKYPDLSKERGYYDTKVPIGNAIKELIESMNGKVFLTNKFK